MYTCSFRYLTYELNIASFIAAISFSFLFFYTTSFRLSLFPLDFLSLPFPLSFLASAFFNSYPLCLFDLSLCWKKVSEPWFSNRWLFNFLFQFRAADKWLTGAEEGCSPSCWHVPVFRGERRGSGYANHMAPCRKWVLLRLLFFPFLQRSVGVLKRKIDVIVLWLCCRIDIVVLKFDSVN